MELKNGEDGGKWVRTTTEVETVDFKGEPLVLRDVPAERNEKTGAIRVDPDDVARSEIEEIASRHSVVGRQLPLLLMLFAKPGPFSGGSVNTKYKLNKMLFYQWKRLGEQGLGESYPKDEFRSARAGPVPIHLRDDLKALEAAGLAAVQWSERKPGVSTRVELTPKGMELARRLWFDVPEIYRDATMSVKVELFPLDPETIKAKVHEEYPKLRRTYVEVDAE